MESNWRFNVWDLGATYMQWELIARLTGVPFGLWIAKRRIFDGMYDTIRPPGLNQPPAVLATSPIPVTDPHFPYGRLVLPDH